MSRSITQSTIRALASSPAWPGRLLLVLYGLASLPLLERALGRLAGRLMYIYPNDGLEGTLLHEARLVAAGEPLYRPLARHEFVAAPYPPVHTALVAIFDQALAGPHPFWGARLVSALAAIGIALLIVLIVHAAGGSWLAGIPGAAIFFCAPPTLLWGSRIKPDMLAICFAMLGLFCTLRGIPQRPPEASSRRPSSWLLAAAAAFVLAFFTRQTTIVAAGAAGLALALNDLIDWRGGARGGFVARLPVRLSTLWFGLALLGLALGVWALADLLTGGQYTAHVWGLHRSEWWSLYLVKKYALLLSPYQPALLLAGALLFWAARSARARALACYVVVAPATLLGAAEISANHNHLLESLVAVGLVCGAALAWAVSGHPPRTIGLPMRVAVLALLTLQLWMAYQPQPYFGGEFRPSDPPERFVAFIRGTPGEILADDVGLLIAGGKPVRYDDPSTMGPAARWGIWDQRGLLEEIEQRKFSAIMIRDNVEEDPYDDVGRWTSEMRAAIRDHYVLKFDDRINVYVPR